MNNLEVKIVFFIKQNLFYLQGVGQVGDDATLGRGLQDLGDLANDALDLVGDVHQVPLGHGGVGVEDAVDAVDHLLEAQAWMIGLY